MRDIGLLKKAQLLRSPPRLRLLRPDELRAEPRQHHPDDEITPEERQKVDSQIEEILARSRLKVTPETWVFRPRKNGGILPIVINAAAVIIVVAGVLIARQLSRQKEQAIVAAPALVLSAEGKMVEALKEQARQELENKDKEISSIQKRLSGIDEERARIQQDAAASVRQKEQELQDAFARSLQDQRAKLEASGLSAQAVNARLAALQEKNAAERDAQLEAFRRQADADRAAREKTITDLQASYQQELAQAQSDRSSVLAESSRREAELEAGYKQKQLSLEHDTAAAQAELASLRQQRSNEQLVLDQLLSWYQKVRDQIQASQPAAARAVLADFREFLDDPKLAALPAVAQRRPVDLFLVDSLDELVRSQAAPASAADNTQALVASANLISTVASLVQQGDALYKDQGYTGARELYLSALSRIPAVQAGYEKLGAIEKIFADRQKTEVTRLLAVGNAAYRAGDFPTAADRYGKALEAMQGDPSTASQLVAQLTAIGAQGQEADDAARIGLLEGDAAARARGLSALDKVQAQLAAARVPAGQGADSRASLVALLETKLLVQQIILRPDVVHDHPDLYDKLNRYLDALAAESRAEARLETLRDLDALLGGVPPGSVPPAAEMPMSFSPAPRFSSPDEQEILLSILSRVRALLK